MPSDARRNRFPFDAGWDRLSLFPSSLLMIKESIGFETREGFITIGTAGRFTF